MKKLVVMVCLLSVVFIQSSLAFDGNREGFIIGLGLGLQETELNIEKNGVKAGLDMDGTLATSFKLGYGFNNNFLLHYTNDVSWVKVPNNSDSLFIGVTTISGTYYFNEKSPSAFITVGLGAGAWSNLSNTSPEESLLGSGWILGGGYEFKDHVNVEISLFEADFSNDTKVAKSGTKIYTPSIRFTVNYLWY